MTPQDKKGANRRSIANREKQERLFIRSLKTRAHELLKHKSYYGYLADCLNLPRNNCHFSQMNKEQLIEALTILNKLEEKRTFKNMVDFGNFELNEVIIKEVKSSYNRKGVYISVCTAQDKEQYLGVLVNDTNGADLVHMQRYGSILNIKGRIYKNPKTMRIIYAVDDAKEQIKEI